MLAQWKPLGLLAAILAGAPVTAQIVLNPPKDASVISVDVDLVNVLCSVRDKHGAYVKDLGKDDFEIRENGKKREIAFFAREVDTPLTVALLIDVSGSVQSAIYEEKVAAARFFSQVLRPRDKAMLVGFAQLIAVWQDLTGSLDTLSSAMERVQPFTMEDVWARETKPRGGTLLDDAVKLVAENKLKRLPGRKAMILITDGEDNGSLVTPAAAARAAQEADAVVYGIHYLGSARQNGFELLAKMSDLTGGRTFHIDSEKQLQSIFDQIAEEMRNQYGLGFTPLETAKTGDRYHRLDVKLLKPGLKVQARSGFYWDK
jgi:VWFA-related protein